MAGTRALTFGGTGTSYFILSSPSVNPNSIYWEVAAVGLYGALALLLASLAAAAIPALRAARTAPMTALRSD